MARILLTTRCRDSGLYGYFRENAPRNFRWRFGMPRRISFGLRFLRQNIPDISILDYPTRTEFSAELRRGWDVVGFSFYLEETDWSKFDTKHLVWNHPHCAAPVLEGLLEQGFRNCYGGNGLRRTMKKFIGKRWFDRDLAGVLSGPVGARWAAPHRLPFLPAPSPRLAAAARRAERAHTASA